MMRSFKERFEANYVNVSEASFITGVSERRIKLAIRSGDLPYRLRPDNKPVIHVTNLYRVPNQGQ